MTLSRTSQALFVVAVVVLAAFALVELPRRRAAERAQEHARRLFATFAAPVDAVDIVRPNNHVHVEVRGTHWQVVAPIDDAAEYSRVATLIDAMEKAEVERNLGPAENAAYGLSPPAAVVTLTAASDTVAYLELGAHTVDDAMVYARRRDGDVVLVAPTVVTAATLPADAYRDQRLVRVDIDEVAAFTVRRDRNPAVRWDRRGAAAWFTVEHGDTVAGDSVEVPMYLRRFRGMRVRSFVEPADTTGAFDHPAGVVTLHKRAPAPAVTLRFAARADSGYVCRVDGEPRVVLVHGDVPGALDASVATLRDRRLLQFSPLRAKRIQFATADTSAVLVRAGGAWALPNPALGRVDPRAAADLVRTLRALRYARVVETPPSDVEPSAFTLLVAAEGDTILDELRGRPRPGSDEAWIVTSRSSRVVAELPASDVRAIVDRLRRLRTTPHGR